MRSGGTSLRLYDWLDASPERVFDAWINLETARGWLFTTPVDQADTAALDPRPGGAWSIAARRAGIDYSALGEYLEVNPPRRLVFTFAMPQFSPNSDLLTFEIAPDGAGCVLTLTQEGIDIAAGLRQLPPDVLGGSEAGWHQMFAALAATLAATLD